MGRPSSKQGSTNDRRVCMTASDSVEQAAHEKIRGWEVSTDR